MYRYLRLLLLSGPIALCSATLAADTTAADTTAADTTAADTTAAETTPSRALSGRDISISDAVRITLRSHPAIEQARQDLAARQARVQEESGVFDRNLSFEGDFTFDERELIGSKLEQEQDRRRRLGFVADAVARTSVGIAEGSRNGPTLFFQLQCDDDQDQIIIDTGVNGRFIICRNTEEDDINAITLAVGDANDQSLRIATLLRLIDNVRDDLRDDLEGLLRDQLRTVAFILDLVARTLFLQLERLGPIPDEIQLLELDLLLSHQFRFRNGSSLTASLSLNSTEENFGGKPLNPDLGDSAFPNTFTSAAGLSLTFPLGKGRGRKVTQGPENAAKAQLQAARSLLFHTASSQALETVKAYWQLASAQQRLALLKKSRAVQINIRQTVEALVEADEITRNELSRVGARIAEVEGQIAAGRQAVLSARFDLVAAMGLKVDQLEHSPLAGDGLPEKFSNFPNAEEWLTEAYAQRHDLAATRHAQAASATLAYTAKGNLRHQVDFSLNASYNGLYESFSERFYEPQGFLEAWQGIVAGPSYGFGLRWRVPVRNNTARGRLVQARAAHSRSAITETELERTIRLSIVEIFASLEQSRRQRLHLLETLGYQQQTLDGSQSLLREGEITLIDTLLTEQQLTDGQLSLVDVENKLAQLEAQLLFESGRLLAGNATDPEADPARWQLALLSSPGKAP